MALPNTDSPTVNLRALISLSCAVSSAVFAQPVDYRPHDSAPAVSVYINPNADGVRRTANGGWDYSPAGAPACVDDHFWSGLHRKLGLGAVRNMDSQNRLFQGIAVEVDDQVRFNGIGPISIGPYGSGRQCVFFLVPSTYTHRSSSQLYDKWGISPDLVLLKTVPLERLTRTVAGSGQIRATREHAAVRKLDQRELPPGMTYDFYDLGGQWHGDRLYTPMLHRGTWKEANAFCESLVFAGASGWKLPTPQQILSLAVDRPYGSLVPNRSRQLDEIGETRHFWTNKRTQDAGWYVAMPLAGRGKYTSSASKAANEVLGVVCTK